MLRSEHLNQLGMPDLYVTLYNTLLLATAEFMQQGEDQRMLKVWSMSSSHNGVIHMRLEGEEILYAFLVKKGFNVKMSYLHLEIYPSKEKE